MSDWGERYNIGDPKESGAVVKEIRMVMYNPRDKNVIGVFYINCFGKLSKVKRMVEKWLRKHYPQIKVPKVAYPRATHQIDPNKLPTNIEAI
jgi:hypothetical protein